MVFIPQGLIFFKTTSRRLKKVRSDLLYGPGMNTIEMRQMAYWGKKSYREALYR